MYSNITDQLTKCPTSAGSKPSFLAPELGAVVAIFGVGRCTVSGLGGTSISEAFSQPRRCPWPSSARFDA